MKRLILASVAMTLVCSCAMEPKSAEKLPPEGGFPFEMPLEKPTFKMSAAMNRQYDNWQATRPQLNELYSQFRYTALKGLNYGTMGRITRRDPSRIVKANGKYYVWYTLRNTPQTYVGADKANDVIPSTDWDLCDIGYATSEDGFTWKEQGVAVPRPPKPAAGWRSVSTPDVLAFEGKYYLYYQAFSEMSGKRGDDCPVAVSWADSPDGPWHAVDGVVIPNGAPGAWDQYSIHDPQPIVMPKDKNGKSKIHLYYKSDYNGKPNLIRSTGLAIADSPLGPFTKYELNPVMNSGHETQMFRFKEGVAAILDRDGNEANTIQYAADGKEFQIAAITEMLPAAAGVYDPDAFNGAAQGRGITWGLCHTVQWGDARHSYLIRFDCDLSTEIDDPNLKKNIGQPHTIDERLKRGLTAAQRKRINAAAESDLK